jgi:hypothetical protein
MSVWSTNGNSLLKFEYDFEQNKYLHEFSEEDQNR